MNIPAWTLMLGFVLFIFSVLSGIALFREIPLTQYWASPIGVALPWIFVLILGMTWTAFEANSSRGQAMGMSLLFPLFGLFGTVAIACIVSFFVPSETLFRTRLLWSLGISSIPATVVGAIMINAYLD